MYIYFTVDVPATAYSIAYSKYDEIQYDYAADKPIRQR